MLSRSALRVLHSLPKPVLIGGLLSGAVVASNAQYPGLQPIREPSLVAITGFVGFLVASSSRLSNWRLELIAGMLGALLVAGFYLTLTLWLRLTLQHPLELALLRAVIIGSMGAGLARLLRQRAVL